MQLNPTNTESVPDDSMPKTWMQIRIEKDTASALDKIHVERRESYNDIIIRLIEHWTATHPPKE
jgi:hypothetical protein